MVTPIEYLRWHESHRGGTHDLATSDQHAVAGEWDVVPDVLADRQDPPDGVTLREQLAAVYGVAPERVLVAAGATQANVAAFGAAVGGRRDDGEAAGREDGSRGRILVELPGYEPLVATPRWLGAAVDRFRRPADEEFPLDPSRIDGALGEDTDLVVATNRHNPSGRRVDRDALADAAEAARRNDARLLVDEVYAPFGTVGTDGPFGGPTAAGIDGAVVTGSLTKFFGLGGLRVGWLVADEAFVERAREVLYHLPSVATPGEALARRALHHREAIANLAREQCRATHEQLAAFVDDRDDLTGPVFEGSTFAFLGHERADGDAVAEAAADHDCTVVPGRFFDEPGRFRVSLGGQPDAMAASLSALGAALDGL